MTALAKYDTIAKTPLWPRCAVPPVADAAAHKCVPRSIDDVAGLSARKISGTANGGIGRHKKAKPNRKHKLNNYAAVVE